LALDQKFKITQNDINQTFDQVKTCEIIWSNENIKKIINKTFNQVTKSALDQMPNLTETFDQVKRSSEIWSSECFPFHLSQDKL
jgi:outer membrane lipoprotein-sorting protein